MKTFESIDDQIENCKVEPTKGTILELLNICSALNRRISELEAGNKRTANIASCLANGIQPD